MEHRIRAAGILIEHDQILLLKIRDETGEYWLPPGGGFEEGDGSTKGCLRREFREEAGVDIVVGELICVREFLESTTQRYNAEFFYHVRDFQGAPHLENLFGLNDEDVIQSVEWVDIARLDSLRTYPSDIKALVDWVSKQTFSHHLGSYIQGNDEQTNHLN